MAVGYNPIERILTGHIVWIDKTINHIQIKVPGLVDRIERNRSANRFKGKRLK